MAEDFREIYAQAVAAHEGGDYVQATECYEKILARFPDADLILYNQGLALFELGRFAEAAASFAQATEICPDNADIWFNLGLSLKGEQRYTDAGKAYERALELQPDDLDTLFNLANCCREGGEVEQAATYYERLLKLEPEHVSGLNNFAYLRHRQQEYSRAKKLYQRLLTLQPDHPGATHMLAALRGEAVDTPKNDYVRDLFDQYSTDFEQNLLEKLEYRVPELLFALAKRCDSDRSSYANSLDLGCGTGLAGAIFRPICKQLIGVDLSEKMLARAAEKGVYDRLAADDVIQFILEEKGERYDLIMAADLLTYLADLEPLFQAVTQVSSAEMLFIFSIEQGWQVQPTGRFAHHPNYISDIADRCGWKIVCTEQANLRREGNAWVRGMLFAAAKK